MRSLRLAAGRQCSGDGRLRQYYRRGACLVVNDAAAIIVAPRPARGGAAPVSQAESRFSPPLLCALSAKKEVNPMKLAVPDMISNSYFPAEAAVELGFFRDEGLDVTLELIFPVDKAYAALRDGAVDFVGGSAHSALAAFPQWRRRQADLRAGAGHVLVSGHAYGFCRQARRYRRRSRAAASAPRPGWRWGCAGC